MVDMTIDTESNVVYIASCTSFFVYKMCSAGNTGKLNAVFYDPDTFTAISSLQYSNTFSGLSGILLIGHNLVIVHHDQNYLTEITLSGDKTSISSTTQHPFRDSSGTDISMSYYTNVFALDSSRSSIWIASSHSSDENFYQMNINTWRMTIHTGFFSKVGRDAVHNAKIYSRTVLFPPSGSLMYVGGYKIVVKDYLDGTGELLSGDNYNGGWFYEPWKNARTFNRFFEVQSLALSPDGLFLYVGSLDNKFGTIKRIALGLPETRATHTNMCSCVQDAVSSFGNLIGICVECPDVANMISPAEEDTCACRPQYFPDFKTEVGFLSNPLGPIGSKTRIAYFGSGSGTIAKGIAFDFDEDYFWVVKQENLLMLRVSDGSVVKTFSEYKTDTNFHSGSFKAIKRSMLTGDHIWMVANSEIYKINTADGLEICSYRPSENPRQFYVSKDETFLIFSAYVYDRTPAEFHYVYVEISGTDGCTFTEKFSRYNEKTTYFFFEFTLDASEQYVYSSSLGTLTRFPVSYFNAIDTGTKFSMEIMGTSSHGCRDTDSYVLMDGDDTVYMHCLEWFLKFDLQTNSFVKFCDIPENLATQAEMDYYYCNRWTPGNFPWDLSRDGKSLLVLDGKSTTYIEANAALISAGPVKGDVYTFLCTACPPHSSTRYLGHRPHTETGNIEDCICDPGFEEEIVEKLVLQINPWGPKTETIVWGEPGTSGHVDDANPANVRFNSPSRVFFANGLSDNLYVLEMWQYKIRKIDLSTRSTSTAGTYTTLWLFVEMAPDGTLYGGNNDNVVLLNADYSAKSTIYTLPAISNGMYLNNYMSASHGVFSADGNYMFVFSGVLNVYFVVLDLRSNPVTSHGPYSLYVPQSASSRCSGYDTHVVLSPDEKTLYYTQSCGSDKNIKKVDSCSPDHYSTCNPSPTTLFSHADEQVAGIALYGQNTLLFTHFNLIKKIDLSVQPYTVETFMEGSFTGEGNRFAQGGLAVSPDNLFLVSSRSTHNVRLHSLGHWYELQNISQCSPCDIGWYSNGSLGASCQPCPVGSTAAPGAGKSLEDCRCDLLSENSVVSATGDFCTCKSDAFFVDTQTVYDEIPNEHGPLGQTVTQYESSDTNLFYYTDYKTALSQDGQFMYLRAYTGSEYTLARFNFASQQIQHLFYDDGPYTNFFLTNNDKYVWFEDAGQGLFQLDVETLVTGAYSEGYTSTLLL